MATYHHLSSFHNPNIYSLASESNSYCIFVSHSVNRLFNSSETITPKWSTGSRFWLQGVFRESHSGWSTLYFLSKKQTNFSAAPAPFCPVGFGEADSMSFQPTLHGCVPVRICTDRRLLEKNQGHRYNNTAQRICSSQGEVLCLSHTLEIKTSVCRRILSSINLTSLCNLCRNTA